MTQLNSTQDAEYSQNLAPVLDNTWGQLVSLCDKYPSMTLKDPVYTFGRNRNSCNILFDEPAISGVHCRITRDDENLVWIEDLSTNGTFICNKNLPYKKVGKHNKEVISSGTELTLLAKKNQNNEQVSFIIYFTFDSDEKLDADANEPHQKYDIRENLGSGAFATVKLCVERSTGKKFAMKVVDKKKFALHGSSHRPGALLDEVRILQGLDHPNIIRVYDYFDMENQLFIVLEYVSGGELFDRIVSIGRFTENRAKFIFSQMLDALTYMHSKSIIHRDLKPENVLLQSKSEDVIKLSDFGLSRTLGSSGRAKTLCGTPQYLAPEVTHSPSGYTKQCDMWSLGVILYILLSGSPPFDEDSDTPLADQMAQAQYTFPRDPWASITPQARDLVCRLLTPDPVRRITSEQAAQHAWLTDGSQVPDADDEVTVANSKKRKAMSLVHP